MNKTLDEKLNEVGLTIPNILFPRDDIDLTKFSCIAADQYTHDIKYWNNVKAFVEDAPSTYNIIYPEAYLESELEKDNANIDEVINKKITSIRSYMDKYIDENIYTDIGKCFIYVERKSTPVNRKGLLVAIDLEKYDYNTGAKSLMRATELTVKERLVVRKKIRENATLDMPHILVLINDKEDALFGELSASFKKNKLYDFDLMMDGGHIEGYKVDDTKILNRIADILCDLKKDSNDGFLYAVGDGNHSLAAAKDSYVKTGKGRFALVELVNIYDKGLKFFPIHRLIKNCSKEKFKAITNIDPDNPLPLQELQKVIDECNFKIDYIHGKDECLKLAEGNTNTAIVYDKFSFETLFEDVIKNGSLCRKSFSMGEANDKRFYLEAQKII